MLTLNQAHEPDDVIITRVAWLYHVVGLNQEEVASRLGLHRTRVVRLLSEARERGIISIQVNHDSARDLQIEQNIKDAYGLDFCLMTPAVGFTRKPSTKDLSRIQSTVARRAVGTSAAAFLKGKLATGPVTIGISWGRTIEQVAQQLSGITNIEAHFVSLIGSLTKNAASNPFEVAHAFASRTGGSVHFLPLPFLADSASDRAILMSQRVVLDALAIAKTADFHIISVGELKESAALRSQDMLSAEDIASLRALGAVGDTLGRFFAADGRQVSHPVVGRVLAVPIEDIRGSNIVLLAAGLEKIDAIRAVLASGLVKGLIIDGDTAVAIDKELSKATGLYR